MKNLFRISILSLVSGILLSCGNIHEYEDIPANSEPQSEILVLGEDIPSAELLEEMNVYVNDELAMQWEAVTDQDGWVRLQGVKASLPSDIVSMRRLFPYAGKFEARTRAEGLHRWYKVIYRKGYDMQRASAGLAFQGVQIIEYSPKVELVGQSEEVVYEDPSVYTSAQTSALPFNDPMLSRQWHYYNNGRETSSVSGCDINVLPVWNNYTTGNPDIIVGVVDGGIDFNHEDLADNMWINPEKKGDNRFGYNFVSDSYTVTPDKHGTHVAGTIAAINNNGIGVCGIAGGDYMKGQKGVRLMSCQIFEGEQSASGPEAIKWSADHGAIISQNSWGYKNLTSTPLSLKNAVDYFIKYAGLDENRIQVGPMRGGIVIFSAGNDATDVSGNDYEAIVNVASLGADYRRAYYSNYGAWVDVAAPGGDAQKGNQVLSTFPGNKYGRYQGTSMACPHVSGVAALLLSRYGGTGYTPEALRARLEGGVTDISSFNKNYYLGKGLVNAYKAMAGSGGKAPDKPTSLSVATNSNSIVVSVAVPNDDDDGTPSAIYIYYSQSDFSSRDGVEYAMLYTEGLAAGSILHGTIPSLEFNTQYYVAACACDLAGNFSDLTNTVKTMTGGNNAPVINAVPTASSPDGKSITIKSHESGCAEYLIADPDNHFFKIEFDPGSEAAVLDTLIWENPKIWITGVDAPSGHYLARMKVTDIYGLSDEWELYYTILDNHAPYVTEILEDRLFSSKSAPTVEMNSSDFFNDDDGETLKFSFEISNTSVVNMTHSGGKFYLTPINYGMATVTVTGEDVRKERVTQSFRVLVRNGNSEVEVFPNPVTDFLNIRTSSAMIAEVKIISSTGAVIFSDTMEASPFEPAIINMSSCMPGVYTVSISISGSEHKFNIIKI